MKLKCSISLPYKPLVLVDDACYLEIREPFEDEVESRVFYLSNLSCRLTFPLCVSRVANSVVVVPIAAF